MFNFLRSRDPLQAQSPESTAQFLCRLVEEQNALLRELVEAVTGHPSKVLRHTTVRPVSNRIRTDKDVFRVGREQILQQESKQAEADQAPWRTPASGQDSASPPPTSRDSASAPSAPPKGTAPTHNVL